MAVVVTTAAVTLVLEILAMRLVAPYVGLTLETYSAAIGIALLGIAAGAWLGGQLADSVDPRLTLGPTLIAGGALVFLTRPVVIWLGPGLEGRGATGALVLVAAATAPAIVVLSMAHPGVVKLRLAELARTGSTVGALSAAGTLGALGGTFLTGFVLLGSLSTRTIVLGAGALTIALGVGVMLALRARPPALAALIAVPTLAALLAADGPCQRETAYYCVQVVSQPDAKRLQLDNLTHSVVDVEHPDQLRVEYLWRVRDVIDAAFGTRTPLRALHLGGGAFTLPRYLASARPGSRSKVLELDPGVVAVAREQFGLRTGPALAVRTGDARVGVRDEPSAAYDLVMGDAFSSRSVPWHLTTREFAAEIRRVLEPSGLYVMNLIDAGQLRFVKAELATLLDVFGHAALVAFPEQDQGNFIVVASARPLPLSEMRRRTSRHGHDVVAADDLVAGASILSDDFAPVDQLMSRFAAADAG